MAETKTTIPVEIKMGNAGAEGANLPAFKEGSIIFTKDTKKIYIDPVGETERIAVGGEVDLSGKQDKITKDTELTAKSLHTTDNIRSNSTVEVGYTAGVYASLNARSLGFFSGGYGSFPEIYMNYTSHVGTTPTKLYISSNIQESDVGHRNITLSGISTPISYNDAVNKAYVDTTITNKQDKFATVTTADTVQTVKIGDTLSITTTPNLSADTIKSTGVLELTGNETTNSYVSLRATKLANSCDFDAKQGYLRVRDDPLADDFAVNKKYVDDAIGNITALFASLVDMTKTTQSDEPVDDTEIVNDPTDNEEETVNA